MITPLIFRYVAAAFLLAFFMLSTVAPNVQAQAPDAPPSVTGGRILWIENCAPCHGPGGVGNGPAAEAIANPLPNFTEPDAARAYVPLENFGTIKNGRIDNMMPPWGNQLTDKQIWDLTAQVWHLSTTTEDLAAGEVIYTTHCAACHGDQGAGDGANAAAQINDFTDVAQMIQISQNDLQVGYTAAEAHTELIALTDPELWQVLHYVRTFSFAIPQRNGRLAGRVTNATTDQPEANLGVTLRVFEGDREVETLTTQSDAQGNYGFAGLPADPNVLFLVEGQYQDIVYEGEQLGNFVHSETEINLDLNVFETTTDASQIEVSQLHYLMSFGPEGVNVLQIFVVANDGDRTYIGDGRGGTFPFSLPDLAENLILQGDITGDRFLQNDNGYIDTRPVIPGAEGLTVAATYVLPYDEDSILIETPLLSNIRSVNILIEDRGVSLESRQVSYIENRDIQGNNFALFTGGQLSEGEILRLELSDLSNLTGTAISGAGVASPIIDQGILRWTILSLGLVAIVGAGVAYPLTRTQQLTPTNDPTRQRQRLLLLIAGLDQRFEDGELSEQVYRQARNSYKVQLATIMESHD